MNIVFGNSIFIVEEYVFGQAESTRAHVRRVHSPCVQFLQMAKGERYAILGDRLLPYLSKNLTQSQMKLVIVAS